ncbi:4-diphosphocytidyl-2C-methyl-D-erythritol kinase [Lysobacter sp. HA35]
MTAWTAWPAPAKLNLFLHITGRRDDGYHRLQTVFRLLDWGDTIRLRLRDDGRIERVGEGPDGVDSQDDLAVRAAIALQRAANVAQGADIELQKQIPTGGGFGGGSSDAATVLVALNRLWRVDWPLEKLAELGLSLGADVPVFVLGRNAWAEGVGEVLTPMDLRPAWYIVAEPGVHCPTASLFASPDLTRDSPPLKMADFVAGGDPREWPVRECLRTRPARA